VSTAATHRLLELLVGFPLFAFCCYEIYKGRAFGSFRSYYRDESPWSYWMSIALHLAIAAAFLFGLTAWRS
jgi:hypothetical protein